MPKKKEAESITDIEAWYTAGEAAKALSMSSGKPVRPDYISKLASLGKLRSKKINTRLKLYSKEDVDAYRVEERGIKSGAAKKMKAQKKR
jgi:hypothetical protein